MLPGNRSLEIVLPSSCLSNTRHSLTRHATANYRAKPLPKLGTTLRGLREKQDFPLWKVAAAAEMDAALLSKIELGKRPATPRQVELLAKFFRMSATELESMRIAEKVLSENDSNPAALALALIRIQESAGEYRVNRRRASASNPTRV